MRVNVRAKALAYSLLAALLFWISDAAVQFLVRNDVSFIAVLLPAPREASSRFLAGMFFLLMGFIAARILERDLKARSALQRELEEKDRMGEELRNLSLTDELTGLHNRRGFFALGEQQLKVAHRDRRRVFMLYADLDNLKQINDEWGHQEGDIALIDAANLLRETFRESDIVARIGGDEFVAFPVGTSESSAERVAGRFREKLLEFNRTNERRFELSVSLGIPAYDPARPCTLDRLLAEADDLMYAEKNAKRGTGFRRERRQGRLFFVDAGEDSAGRPGPS